MGVLQWEDDWIGEPDMKKLTVQNFGQIKKADVDFADLNVFVGPQATGKRVFLQLVKLLLDNGPVIEEFKCYSTD